MALVVFMRGVNVGGHKAFRPAVVAKELAEFDVVNIGAAGTFVVRGRVSESNLRKALMRRLPFAAEVMICKANDVRSLASNDRMPRSDAGSDVQRFVSILAKRPRRLPALPISHPAAGAWQVKVVAVTGYFVLSMWRRLDRPSAYPNEVVEKHFGEPATTRNWKTIERICRILDRQE